MSNDIDNVTPKGVLLVVSGPSEAGKDVIGQIAERTSCRI